MCEQGTHAVQHMKSLTRPPEGCQATQIGGSVDAVHNIIDEGSSITSMGRWNVPVPVVGDGGADYMLAVRRR